MVSLTHLIYAKAIKAFFEKDQRDNSFTKMSH